MVVHASNPSIQEQFSTFEASLGYMRACLKIIIIAVVVVVATIILLQSEGGLQISWNVSSSYKW